MAGSLPKCFVVPENHPMASHNRIFNTTKRCWWKPRHVEQALDACAVEWVEPGLSVRDLTLQESTIARNTRARLAEPMPYAELHHLSFDPAESGVVAHRMERRLVAEARTYFEVFFPKKKRAEASQ